MTYEEQEKPAFGGWWGGWMDQAHYFHPGDHNLFLTVEKNDAEVP